MLSEETKRLMNKEEDIEVEYKRKLTENLGKSLVSFANSEYGGFILIGVEETTNKYGRQKGQLYESKGIKLTDENKTKIESIRSSCRDNLPAQVIKEEERNGYGIYKIKIPPRRDKLYCTGGGRYVIRINGRNELISPTLLRGIIIGTNKPNLKLYFIEYQPGKTSLTVKPVWKVKIKAGKNEKTITPPLGIKLPRFNIPFFKPVDETQDELPSVGFQLVNEGTSTANEIHAFITFPESFELFTAFDLTSITSRDSGGPDIDEDKPYEVSFYQKKLVQGLAVNFSKVGVKPPKEKQLSIYSVFYKIYAEEGQFKGELSLHIEPTFKKVEIYE